MGKGWTLHPEYKPEFGKNVRVARKALHWTQLQLAEAIGKTRKFCGSLSRLERGGKPPDNEALLDIVDVLEAEFRRKCMDFNRRDFIMLGGSALFALVNSRESFQSPTPRRARILQLPNGLDDDLQADPKSMMALPTSGEPLDDGTGDSLRKQGFWTAAFHYWQGQSNKWLEAGDEGAWARATLRAGLMKLELGEADSAQKYFSAIANSRVGDVHVIAHARLCLGTHAYNVDRFDDARAHVGQALDGLATSLLIDRLALLEMVDHDLDRLVDNPRFANTVADCLHYLGGALTLEALATGNSDRTDYAEAYHYTRRALTIYQRLTGGTSNYERLALALPAYHIENSAGASQLLSQAAADGLEAEPGGTAYGMIAKARIAGLFEGELEQSRAHYLSARDSLLEGPFKPVVFSRVSRDLSRLEGNLRLKLEHAFEAVALYPEGENIDAFDEAVNIAREHFGNDNRLVTVVRDIETNLISASYPFEVIKRLDQQYINTEEVEQRLTRAIEKAKAAIMTKYHLTL
jgi:transcriptional regulator with XRE-family HTH domain